MLEQNRTGDSETVVGQHVRPERVWGVWGLRDDPEALFGVVNDRDGLAAHRGHGPIAAQEIQRGVGVESALMVESQVEI